MNDLFQSHWRSKLRFLDVHYHVAPDAFRRRHGVLSAGQMYQMLNGGVVLKNHLGDSVASAEAAREIGLPVFGSLVLNAVAGGPCWRSVEESLCKLQAEYSGRLLVHLPTFTSSKHESKLNRHISNKAVHALGLVSSGVSNEDGSLRQEVIELLHMSRDYPVVISTGHANRKEVMQLIDATDRLGGLRLMLNQPANPMTGLNGTDLASLANADWLYIEQTALTYLLNYQGWEDFAYVLTQIPNVVYSSDLGQHDQPDIDEWYALSQTWFDQMGLNTERRNAICLDNALAMLAP